MAVTKIHPIKSTLKKALDYIENSDKTDDKLLVSSFACSYETADIEFEMLLTQAYQKGNNLAHHLIQSFAPREATAEQAHEIGKQLADEVLQGKYPYVLTTHIDKGHVHNHIIFCAVDMINQRKYVSNKQSYAYIRRTSDRLCKEHGLSVVKPGQSKGKSYAEWDAQRKGTSWKAKLKVAIDAAIPQAKDFDDFLRLMQEAGYEIKTGKYISFRAKGQERFTRSKTIGENYTEERIKERIAGRTLRRSQRQTTPKGISLIRDIQERIRLIDSRGYEYKAKLTILKEAARTLNYLTENSLLQYADLEKKVEDVHSSYDRTGKELKGVEARLREVQPLIKNISNYQRLKPVYDAFQKAKDKPSFKAKHEAELVIFEAARSTLLAMQGDEKLPSLKTLQAEQQRLLEEQQRLYDERAKLKKEVKQIETIKSNVDTFLAPSADHDRDHLRSTQRE